MSTPEADTRDATPADPRTGAAGAGTPPVPLAPWLTRNLLLLSITSFLGDISSEMIYPLVPLFLTGTLGASKSVVGFVEGAAEATAQLSRLASGVWSDWIGRRKPMTVMGYLASALGRVVIALADAWPVVLAARIVDRLGKGLRTTPRDALLAESVPPERRGRAFGFHRAMDTAGAVLGVCVAYAVLCLNTHLRTVFVASVVPAALSVAVLVLVREPPRPSTRTGAPSTARWLADGGLSPPLKTFLLVSAVFTLANSSNQLLVLRSAGHGFDDRGVVLLYLVYNIIYAAASYPAGVFADRVGHKRVLIAGYAAYALVYAGFAACDRFPPWASWALWSAYGLYTGLTDGVEKALLADLAPPDRRATVMGLRALVTGLGLLPASWLAGWLWERFGAAWAFGLDAALAALAALLLAFLLPRSPRG